MTGSTVGPGPTPAPEREATESTAIAATRLAEIDVPLVRPVAMTDDERQRLRDAALRAVKLYPGPVGETLKYELRSWEEFGYRFGGKHSRIMPLVEQILSTPMAEAS